MTRAVFQSYAQDNEGNVLPNASVTVIDEDSGSPVSLFNAYSGGSSLPNPFTADANGFFVFYADPARVKITVTLGGDTSEFRNVRLSGTAAQADLTSPSATIFDDGNFEPGISFGLNASYLYRNTSGVSIAVNEIVPSTSLGSYKINAGGTFDNLGSPSSGSYKNVGGVSVASNEGTFFVKIS